MKTVLTTFIFLSSLIAHAKPLEAWVSCNCSQWVRGHDGEMALVTANIGLGGMPKLSESFSNRLATQAFSQKVQTQTGYASVTPGVAKLFGNGSSIFSDGDGAIDSIVKLCKNYAVIDEGYTNCAVSITFPINEKAKEILAK